MFLAVSILFRLIVFEKMILDNAYILLQINELDMFRFYAICIIIMLHGLGHAAVSLDDKL